MQLFYVCAVAFVICLQIASQGSVTGQVDYTTNYNEIDALNAQVGIVNDYLQDKTRRVFLTYGIKSASDGSYVRAMTSLRLANGDTAVGSALTNPAVINALDAKMNFTGDVVIYGKNYSAMYQPVMNSNGNVTGYFFAGILKS
jgi:hypothetical protein